MIETVRSAAGWRPEELTADDRQLPLTAGHRAEVLAAVAATAETTMADLSPDMFVLPTLGPILRGLTHYGPDHMHSAQRGAHVPALTPQQEAAMDLIERLTHDPRFALTMDLQAGDFQFLDNSLVLHSRTGYEDHPEPERRRDLIRLWLTTPE